LEAFTFLVGDFVQCPPVKMSALYEMPRPGSKNYDSSLAGHKIWTEKFKTVVLLQESMRFAGDKKYGAIMETIRNEGLTDDVCTESNKRVISAENPLPSDGVYRPVIVITNELRCDINTAVIFTHACSPGSLVYKIYAGIDASTRGAQPSAKQVEDIRRLRDDQTGRMDTFLCTSGCG
jgi:hypothetical protein